MKKIYLILTLLGLTVLTSFGIFASPIVDTIPYSPNDMYINFIREWDSEYMYTDSYIYDKNDLSKEQYFDSYYSYIAFNDDFYSEYQVSATTLLGLGVYDLYLGVYGLWGDLPNYKEFKIIENGYHFLDLSSDIEFNVPNGSKWDSFNWLITFEYGLYNPMDYQTFSLTPSYINNLLSGVQKDDNEQPYIRFDFKSAYDIAYQDGYQDGYNQGFDDGLKQVKNYQDGLKDGYNQGYDVGYQDGVIAGNELGYQQARDYYGYYHNGQWITAQAWGQIQFSTGQTSETNYFDVMFTGFFGFITALGGIQLLPGLYIWHFVAFPLVFGIIFFIIGRSGGNDKGGKK